MASKNVMGYGAILLAVLVALTQAMSWSGSLNYLWAVLALVWGIMALME